MHELLIVGAAAAALVVVWRLWFRWFSRRPLSDTDTYAVAVDTDLDSALGAPTLRSAAGPSPSGSSEATAPATADRSRPPAVRSARGPAGRPGRPAAAPVLPDAPVIPRQRGAGDARGSVGHEPVTGGPAGGTTADGQPAGRGADRTAPPPPAG